MNPIESKTPSEETLWTIKQTAKFLQVSVRSLHRLMKTGALPYYKFGHRHIRFKPADLKAHIDRTCRVINSVRARLKS